MKSPKNSYKDFCTKTGTKSRTAYKLFRNNPPKEKRLKHHNPSKLMAPYHGGKNQRGLFTGSLAYIFMEARTDHTGQTHRLKRLKQRTYCEMTSEEFADLIKATRKERSARRAERKAVA